MLRVTTPVIRSFAAPSGSQEPNAFAFSSVQFVTEFDELRAL